ncbi:MAG: peptide chain release factor N(5)-glutamine methyltransferase [Roseovarius sp.]|nr:peptide chain release factor N(5)-glutamine methyltransferase [Roseovarius sp.]
MTVQHALRQGAITLQKAGIETPVLDAEKLMAACLGIEVGRLALHLSEQLTEKSATDFNLCVSERETGKPVSQILGWREFYGRRFKINSKVLDPRPDTEILVETALSHDFFSFADLGTGSGCILLTMLAERPHSTGVGTDISEAALKVAEKNMKLHNLENRCALIRGNWFDAVDRQFDLVVSNPPYVSRQEMKLLSVEVSHEPRIALTDEGDGLDAFRKIIPQSPCYLRPMGRLMVEIGWKQGDPVSGMFHERGFADVAVHSDYDGRDRVVSGVWPG